MTRKNVSCRFIYNIFLSAITEGEFARVKLKKLIFTFYRLHRLELMNYRLRLNIISTSTIFLLFKQQRREETFWELNELQIENIRAE